MTLKLLIADDQPLIRGGVRMLLSAQPDMTVVGEAGDGAEAVRLARELHPDVVIMDLRMPDVDGAEATRALTDASSEPDGLVKVLVLTTFRDEEAVYGALRAGASGFILKDAAPRQLPEAVRAVAAGEAWLDPAIAGQVIHALQASNYQGAETIAGLVKLLTPRELEVLDLMAQGLSNSEIGDKLVVSSATVKTHVARILMKTGSRDRTQAVVLAYQSGLRPIPGTRTTS